MQYDRLNEREETTTNKHPVATGISTAIIALGTFAFICLAIVAGFGCSSPPDTKCSEVSQCDVDGGGHDDHPDGSIISNCTTNGTCPDAATTTVDAPPATSCTSNFWMENPQWFDCNEVNENTGEEIPAHSCDPELLNGSSGCEVKCGPFWATPDQLTLDPADHSFEYRDLIGSLYPRYHCRQRQ